jgi:fluoride ion exporter CrcB/FEX
MDCTNDDMMTAAAAGCSMEESIIPSLMNAFSSNRRELGGDEEQHMTTSTTTTNNNNNNNHRRFDSGRISISGEGEGDGRGPIQPSPIPETEESSVLDIFPNSTRAIINALSIYDETSGVMSRTRETSISSHNSNSNSKNNNNSNNHYSRSRFASLTNAIFSYDESGMSTDSTSHVRKRFDKDTKRTTTTTTTISSSEHTTQHDQGRNVLLNDHHQHQHHHQTNGGHHDNNMKNTILQRFHLREVQPPSAEALSRRSRSHGSLQSGTSNVGSTHRILVTRSYEVKEHLLETIFYVSTSAILGSVVRTYVARIFGFDCETKGVNDFVTPLTSKICVTNGGRTLQTGGALFYDFPANVLGSFVMGFITPRSDEERARLPWLHRDHALQRDDVFHASVATGMFLFFIIYLFYI